MRVIIVAALVTTDRSVDQEEYTNLANNLTMLREKSFELKWFGIGRSLPKSNDFKSNLPNLQQVFFFYLARVYHWC